MALRSIYKLMVAGLLGAGALALAPTTASAAEPEEDEVMAEEETGESAMPLEAQPGHWNRNRPPGHRWRGRYWDYPRYRDDWRDYHRYRDYWRYYPRYRDWDDRYRYWNRYYWD
ncbi:hypothetical protein [Polyangium aurulentum]|uniref:hypothetical protein n=1 Tax=Polyangium aurulentum TaxID=2567896 RepID=UPI0010AE5CAF|nr:hypothetical protein [Polyangium aurulentum]UQA57909.1 hypothetical protein E8A73_042665 [Polyangium aurulentum]